MIGLPEPVGPLGAAQALPTPAVGPRSGPSFAEVLGDRAKAQPVKLSSHAEARLKARNIAWNEERQHQLDQLVQKAAGKGARESLVLMDDVALVVSVRNRTVITAVDHQSLKDNVFTNIDSAVIA
ncbi:MAG: TIGR02530 family flagellar biosynthesis protein [Candidatus Sericytochromatia bacterium]|nr:TIGR02530 family flagellar biosynthesis protein [Candidatus Sericytochromatia bacterium]